MARAPIGYRIREQRRQLGQTQSALARNLGISPSGRLLFSANQNGDNVTIFRRDADTGKLTQAGSIPIGTPMCVRIVN